MEATSVTARPIVVLGNGGHSRVVVDCLRLGGFDLRGFVDPALEGEGSGGLLRLGNDQWLDGIDPTSILLANGIGQMPGKMARRDIFEKYAGRGFTFVTVIHPSAIVASDCLVGQGTQIMAGAVVQPVTAIGANTIVNTSASIDHDSRIGTNCHICPGVVLAGGVTIGDGSFVGLGARVLRDVEIGENALIAAGSTVRENVAPGAFVR